MYEEIKKNFLDMLDVMYNYIKDVVKNNNNFVNTTDKLCDNIYSLEFTDDGITEFKVMAVRVVDEAIEICTPYDRYHNTYNEVEDKALLNLEEVYGWFDLKCMDGYYINTLYNIFENIDEYIK